MQWCDKKPDVSVKPIDQLLRPHSWATALGFIQKALAGTTIFPTSEAEESIASHLATEPLELGGLLLGKVFEIPFTAPTPYPWITIIEKALPSQSYRNSSVSLRMGTEVWTRAAPLLESGLMVVGWYHSHPNLGAFFSGTDRGTQAAFFTAPYALGLVIDPVRKEHKCFFGAASEELEPHAIARL